MLVEVESAARPPAARRTRRLGARLRLIVLCVLLRTVAGPRLCVTRARSIATVAAPELGACVWTCVCVVHVSEHGTSAPDIHVRMISKDSMNAVPRSSTPPQRPFAPPTEIVMEPLCSFVSYS